MTMKKNHVYSVFYYLLFVLFGFFHPWKAIGREHVPEGGALLCGNHTCASDPFFVAMCLHNHPQIRVMAKAELMRVPVVGKFLKAAGIFGIDRGKSDVGAIKEAMRALKNGEKLLMFPEGTRVREGMDIQVHTGAAMLATRSSVPIVPIYIPPKKRWFRRTPIVFGEAYSPEYEGRRPTPEEYRTIAEDLMKRVFALKEYAK